MSRRVPRGRDPRTAAERGYGAAHKREKRRWEKIIARSGGVRCSRPDCLMPDVLIVPGVLWDLDHVDGDKSQYLGPSHRRCNRATAGRKVYVPSPSRAW